MAFGWDGTRQGCSIKVEHFRREADGAMDGQAGYQADSNGEGEEVDKCLVDVSY